MFNLRTADASEALNLTELSLQSKAYWGYDQADMDLFKPELTLYPPDFNNSLILVAEDEDNIAGFFRLQPKPPVLELVSLFVRPEKIGQGLGRILFMEAVARAHAMGSTVLEIVSDPNALGFYERMGAKHTHDTANPLFDPVRLLPVLRLAIK